MGFSAPPREDVDRCQAALALVVAVADGKSGWGCSDRQQGMLGRERAGAGTFLPPGSWPCRPPPEPDLLRRVRDVAVSL
jgi:hypothetical protein